MGNPKYKKKHPYSIYGRRPEYSSPEEMQKVIDEYFEWCRGEFSEKIIEKYDEETGEIKQYKETITIREPERYTITGLGLYLGFSCRETFDYYQQKPEFSDTVKRAKYRVENRYEKALENNNAAGSIFALKNMGWVDKSEIHNTGEQEHNVNIKDLPDDIIAALASALKDK